MTDKLLKTPWILCFFVAVYSMPPKYESLTVEPIRNETENQIHLNISWVPGLDSEPYVTKITIETKMNIPINNNFPGMIIIFQNESVDSFISRNYLAGWSFDVYICGKPADVSEDVCGPSTKVTVQTPSLPPEPIGNVTARPDATWADKMTLEFPCPLLEKDNGTVTGLVVRKKTLKTAGDISSTESTEKYSIQISAPCPYGLSSEQVGGVKVLKSYAFDVMVTAEEFNSTWNPTLFYEAEPRVPYLRIGDGDKETIELVSSSNETLTIQVCASCALNGDQGPVTEVGLFVCTVSKSQCQSMSVSKLTSLSDHKVMWSQAKEKNFNTYYLATPLNWIEELKKNPTEKYEYTIGSDKACSTNTSVFCNGPLPENEEFTVKMLVCNSAGCGEYMAIADFNTNAGIVKGVNCGVAVLGAIAFFVVNKFR